MICWIFIQKSLQLPPHQLTKSMQNQWSILKQNCFCSCYFDFFFLLEKAYFEVVSLFLGTVHRSVRAREILYICWYVCVCVCVLVLKLLSSRFSPKRCWVEVGIGRRQYDHTVHKSQLLKKPVSQSNSQPKSIIHMKQLPLTQHLSAAILHTLSFWIKLERFWKLKTLWVVRMWLLVLCLFSECATSGVDLQEVYFS